MSDLEKAYKILHGDYNELTPFWFPSGFSTIRFDLEKIGESALPVLQNALLSSDDLIRERAAYVLVWSKIFCYPDNLPLLLHTLQDSSPRVREYTVLALREYADERVGTAVVPLLKDHDLDVRDAVIALTGQDIITKIPFAIHSYLIQPLITLIREGDEFRNWFAASMLKRLGDQSYGALQTALLADDNPYLRNVMDMLPTADYKRAGGYWRIVNYYRSNPDKIHKLPYQPLQENWLKDSEHCPRCNKPPQELFWTLFSDMWSRIGTTGWLSICDECTIQVFYKWFARA